MTENPTHTPIFRWLTMLEMSVSPKTYDELEYIRTLQNLWISTEAGVLAEGTFESLKNELERVNEICDALVEASKQQAKRIKELEKEKKVNLEKMQAPRSS